MSTANVRPYVALVALAITPFVVRFAPPSRDYFNWANPFIDIITYVPWMLLGICGFLGWRINQNKILFLCILLTFSYWLLSSPILPAYLLIDMSTLVNVLALSLPFSILFLFMSIEARLISLGSLLRMFVCIAPTLFLISGLQYYPDIFNYLLNYKILNVYLFGFPQATLIGICLLTWWSFRSPDYDLWEITVSVLFGFVPFYTMLYHKGTNPNFTDTELAFTMSCFSAIILLQIYRLFWSKIYIDELTQIPNRRALEEQLNLLSGKYAIAMIDIDHFKKFNDRYGHQSGDQVLKMVALHLAQQSNVKVYRYGGEEFSLLFRRAEVDGAAEKVDYLRKTLAKKSFVIRRPTTQRRETSKKDRGKKSIDNARRVHVTISAGIAKKSSKLNRPEQVIANADKALYKAKSKGRNRVIYY